MSPADSVGLVFSAGLFAVGLGVRELDRKTGAAMMIGSGIAIALLGLRRAFLG